MIVTILLALALSNNYRCLASYYYQTQPQLQVPFGLRYDGYQPNYHTYQNAPAVQYYTSNHIQAPVVPPSPFTYQPPPSTSYFQRTFLEPQPFYNIPPATVHIQQPSPVILRDSGPAAVNNNTVLSTPNTSPQMRGFIYRTNLEGGARSNVVFFSSPAAADLFQRNTPASEAPSTMRTPASDSVDTTTADAATVSIAPVDQFQSLLALLNRQPSGDTLQLQDGILYGGLSNTNRVVVNNRFLATEDISTDGRAENVLPILRSSFIGKRVVTASEALVAEEPDVNANERQSKDILIEPSSELKEPATTSATTTTSTAASTTTADSSTTDVPTSTATTTSTSPSTLTTPIKRMVPIVVAEMTET